MLARLGLALALLLLPCGAALGQATTQPADRFSDAPLTTTAESSQAGEAAPAGPSASRVVLSLCVVAVLIVLLGWAYKRMFAAQQAKGGGAVSLVSRSMLTPRHQVFVLRVGHRLIVAGDSGHGMDRLAEITDPAEVTAVLRDAGGGAEMEHLRAGAFGAALDEAGGAFSRTSRPQPIPSGDDGNPADDPPFDDARGEVQSLIARVRGLAGQLGGGDSAPR